MVKYTNKEKFLKILEKDKYYRGDTSFTIKLYKRYLNILKESGKCNKTQLFQVTTCRNANFYIKRGWSNHDEIKKQLRKMQGASKRNKAAAAFKCKKTVSNWSDKKRQSINKRKNGWCIKSIINKNGVTEEEAKKIIQHRKEKKINSYKLHLEKIGGYKSEWSCRSIEYYLKKGYSYIDALEKVRKIQDTRSINGIINHRKCTLDEAKKIQQRVSNKCKETFDNKTIEFKHNVLLKRTKNFKRTSKASYKFFNKLINACKLNRNSILYGKDELYIYNDKKILFYDFFIKDLNLIIEYNGCLFHPRDKKHEIFFTINESIKKDTYKRFIAEQNGYKVIEVWDTNDEIGEIKKCIACINELKLQKHIL